MLYEQAIAQIAHLRPDELSFSVDYSLILVSHFQLIELTALFERIANYGQTGNARVLMPSIMDPLQLTVVARRGFLPYFGESIRFDEGPGPLAIRFVGQNWPFNRETRAPLMASLASVKFHYGKEFAEVSALVNQLSASFIHRPMAQKCTIGFCDKCTIYIISYRSHAHLHTLHFCFFTDGVFSRHRTIVNSSCNMF